MKKNFTKFYTCKSFKFTTNKINRRVVVTGMGCVTPLGNNTIESFENLQNFKSGIRDLSQEEYGSQLPSNCKIGASVLKKFDAKKYKTLGTDNLLTQITMSAAQEAIDDSKLEFIDKKMNYRTGVYVGSSLPSLNCMTESLSKVFKNDYTHINRMLMLKMLTNLLASNISIKFNLKGPLISPTLACATSLNSIGESFNIIKHNDADIMVCGGSENSVHPLVFHAMNKLSTLHSSNKKISPEKCSRPFDENRSGFVIGEGSGILVLEELSHALNRNAKIYCEIVGYGTFGDAYHLTKPTLNGEGGFRAMAKCLIQAGITPYDVNFINAHATSTEIGDISELNALKNLFGNKKFKNRDFFEKTFENYEFEFDLSEDNLDKENLKGLIINSNKTQIGHLLGAAGSVESIFAILAMKNTIVIDNINTDKPISGLFTFKYENKNNKEDINYVIKNSFAFGGVNTSVLYKKFN